MLPRPFKAENAFAAIDLYGELHPAREVGGDFFDYFTIDNKRVAVSIGDVSGKGVPASLFMAITQSLIRLTLREGGDLAAEIARVNNLLAANNEESMFATAFFCNHRCRDWTSSFSATADITLRYYCIETARSIS